MTQAIMTNSQTSTAILALSVRAKKLCSALLESCWALVVNPTHTYHPEQHYMRGPGPKWNAKHSQSGA
jgi:hypothetical protein